MIIRARVRYIGEKDTLAFDRSKFYEVISVERGWYRIMTELDDDYLFPPSCFELIDGELPKDIYES